jgi:type I restriction enzyme, S subunit
MQTQNVGFQFKPLKSKEFSNVLISTIPSSWCILKLREISEPITKGTTPTTMGFNYTKQGINFFRVENIDEYGRINLKGCYYISEENHKSFLRSQLKENDILFSLAGTLGRVAFINKSMLPANINQALGIVRLKNFEFDHIFLVYLLGSFILQKQVEIEKTVGAQPNISLTQLANFKIIKPSLKEQQKIASIISKVDELIQETDRIIEQTQLLKKGLIQRLLTKGIGHTKFKKTEVGEIPEDWTVSILEDICEKISVGIATSTTKYFAKKGIPLLRNQNIKEDHIDTNDLIYITEDFAKLNSSRALKDGDVICVRTGYPGQSAVVSSNMNGWQTFTTLIVRPLKNKIDSYYLSRFLNSIVKTKIMSLQAGGSQQNLNAGWLSKIHVKLPSLEEQKKIALILSNIDILLERQKKNKQEETNLKKGLMQQLLTGKIRV